MTRSGSDKMGIKQGMRAILINSPANFNELSNLPELDVQKRLSGQFDYIHLFTITQADFHKRFPKLKDHLKPTGMLWVSWPKSGQEETDLKLTTVIKLGYDYGLVESKSRSIDKLWSALKFTHPRQGQVYNNTYGKLKE
ncbi:MAG: hypothetical protein Q7T76_21460 [Ferruginibacter sp.]|nr:hypothetical protein [Ferruginibacter sp.]